MTIIADIIKEKEDDRLVIREYESENVDLIKDFEFDSLDMMIFITKVEKEFNLNIIDNDNFIELLSDYAKLVEWIEQKIGD